MMVKSVGDHQITPLESYGRGKKMPRGSKTPLTPLSAEPWYSPRPMPFGKLGVESCCATSQAMAFVAVPGHRPQGHPCAT